LKAFSMHQQGVVEPLRHQNRAAPAIESAIDVIVKLKAAGMNDTDSCFHRGDAGEKLALPQFLDGDGAGIVIAVGSKVASLKSGDAVCLYPCRGCGQCEYCASDREFMCPHVSEISTCTEFVRAPARNCFAIPAGFSFEQAAAFPTAFLTAWRMLITNAELKPGQWVLIVDIGSGVTTAVLQLAKYLGTRIIVTSNSDERLAKAKEIGAEHGIRCDNSDIAKEVRRRTAKRGVDVVVDCVGGAGWVKSLASLAKGGRLVTAGAAAGATPPTDLRRIFWNDLKVFGSTLGSREEFRQVLSFLQATGTQPVIDRIVPYGAATLAQQRLAEDIPFGKIVLRLDS
jgi:NADPH:quinone reductase-like Zn-dependent oxidoreductase